MYSQELLNYGPRHRTLFIRDEFLRTSEDLGGRRRDFAFQGSPGAAKNSPEPKCSQEAPENGLSNQPFLLRDEPFLAWRVKPGGLRPGSFLHKMLSHVSERSYPKTLFVQPHIPIPECNSLSFFVFSSGGHNDLLQAFCVPLAQGTKDLRH